MTRSASAHLELHALGPAELQAGRIGIDDTIEVSGESGPAVMADIDLVRPLRP